jgi:hypothetical protein
MKRNVIHLDLKLACVGLLLALLVSVSAVFMRTTQPGRFLYFISESGGRGSGARGPVKFIKVDLGNQQVVDHGDLSRDKRVGDLLQVHTYGPLIREPLYNPTNGLLYLVAAAGTVRDEVEYVVETERILGFKLPGFELVDVIGPVIRLERIRLPTFLVSQGWDQLLYYYGEEEAERKPVVVFEWYNADTLKLLKKQQLELPGDWLEWQREKQWSYWNQNIAPLYAGEFKSGEQEPTWYSFTGSLPAEADRLVKQYPSSVFNPTFVSSKVVLWESRTRENIHRYLGKKDGKEQEIEERIPVEYSTGRFVVFDQRGKKLFELNDKELAGDYSKMRTVSPDGRTMYFAASHDRLYAIDLTKKKPPVRIEAHGIDVRYATYFFADR